MLLKLIKLQEGQIVNTHDLITALEICRDHDQGLSRQECGEIISKLTRLEKLEAAAQAVVANAEQGSYGGCYEATVDHELIVNLERALAALGDYE